MQKVIWFTKDVEVVPILSSLSTHPDGGHTIQFKIEGNLRARSNSPQIEGLTDEQLRKAVADGEIKLVILPNRREERRED